VNGVTICVGGLDQFLPGAEAVTLIEQLRSYARGYRGGTVVDPASVFALADAIEQQLTSGEARPISVASSPVLDALAAVLNAIVHQVDDPAMRLYAAVTTARAAA
jgi:hypothetical protein